MRSTSQHTRRAVPPLMRRLPFKCSQAGRVCHFVRAARLTVDKYFKQSSSFAAFAGDMCTSRAVQAEDASNISVTWQCSTSAATVVVYWCRGNMRNQVKCLVRNALHVELISPTSLSHCDAVASAHSGFASLFLHFRNGFRFLCEHFLLLFVLYFPLNHRTSRGVALVPKQNDVWQTRCSECY